VAIQPPSAPPPEAIERGEKPQKLAIPGKYLAGESSGLTAMIKEGRNAIDFKL